MNKNLLCKVFANKTRKIIISIVLCGAITTTSLSYGTERHPNIAQMIQQKTVTLNLKNVSIEKILSEIKKQSGLSFILRNDVDVKLLDEMSLNVTNVTVENALKELFKTTDFTYSITGKVITIVKKPINHIATTPSKRVAVSGVVLDKEKKPISGATVLVLGTPMGAITDAKGNFSLTTNAEASLEITFIGKKTIVLTDYNASQPLTILLEDDVMTVDDVVVTGIFRKAAESFTGSAITVTEKELKQYGNRNIINSLRNIDPSFNIVENNAFGSNPNKLPEIQIRGNSSLPNVDQLKDDTRVGMNTPLVILDGFETSLQTLMDMNENDVSTITLLKDASATSIYGSRGANGVIVITSKAPDPGKMKLSYKGDLSIEMPDVTSYNLLNARDKLQLELEVGKFKRPGDHGIELQRYYNYLLNDINNGVNTDWLSKPLRTGIGHRHNVRLEGGDDSFRYSAAVQYNNIQGAMKGSKKSTFNGTINLTYAYKNLKFTNNLTIGLTNSSESPYGSYDKYVKMNPYFRTHDDNGNLLKILGVYGFGDSNARYDIVNSAAVKNPLYDATLNTKDDASSNTVTNNFSAEWKIIDNLIFRGRLGISQTHNDTDIFFPAEHTKFSSYKSDKDFLRKGSYEATTGKGYNYDGSLNLSYSKTFNEKHLLYAGADYNMRETQNSAYTVKAEGFTNAEMDLIPMALQYEKDGKPFGSESLQRSIGLTGTVNYTYDNRYYVDLSVRLDGSSAFGVKNRFAPFWSAGLGWNLHRENFLKDSKAVNFLKVRGSAGITGSQNFAPYQALSTYKYYTDDRYYNWNGNYLMGLGNENLKWQQKLNYNIGAETRLFGERLILIADYYLTETKDLISAVNIPLSQGFPSYTENIGTMKNEGFELKATVVPIRNENWLWSVTGAIVHNNNKITKISKALADAQKDLEEDKGVNPNILYRQGYSTNSLWLVPSLGVDPATGKEVYRNRFGDATFIWDAKDLAYCGLGEPKYQGNLNTMLRYKDITLTASFGYRFGGQLYNSTLIEKVENVNYDYNVDARVYTDRWKKPGDVTLFTAITDYNIRTNKTSRFVQDENTFNCQNINIMYEIKSPKLQKKLGIQYLSVAANMSDVFYISTVKRERGTSYPFARQMSLTLNVTF